MVILHHNDSDGRASAAIIVNKYQDEPQKIFELEYSSKVPFEHIQKGERVYILDFSLSTREDWLQLLDITDNIIWIDHHGSAIKKWPDLDTALFGKRFVGKAGCMLTWEFVHGMVPAPQGICLVADHDMYAFKIKDSMHFEIGLNAVDASPTSKLWRSIINGDAVAVHNVIRSGQSIESFVDKMNRDGVMSSSFECEIDGHKAIAMNTPLKTINIFKCVSGYDIYSRFSYDGDGWVVSMYTKDDNIDVSAIAVKYGGGGHRGAAGVVFKDQPVGTFYTNCNKFKG